MTATLRRASVALLALLALAFAPRAAQAQKALVYCPVGIDAIGCTNVANALRADATLFPDGVDLGYDGSDVTVDVRSADLSGYSLFVVPSLVDDSTSQPYGLLREAAARLKAQFVGHAAVWSGTPDLGSTNRDKKDALIRNLATWAKAAADGSHGPGVVALLDESDPAVAAPYGWLGQISALTASVDAAVLDVYSNVEVVTANGRAILTWNGLQIGYTNMASGKLASQGGTVEATGGRVAAPVLVTAGGAAGAPSEAIATIRTDKEDYSPGETVTITGTGWAPAESVLMTLHEDPLVHGDRTLAAVADADGRIFNDSFKPEEHDFGVRFVLSAVGQTSGRTAQTTFTDGNRSTFALTSGGAAVSSFADAAPNQCVTAFAQARQGNNVDLTQTGTFQLSSTPAGALFYAGGACTGSGVATLGLTFAASNNGVRQFAFKVPATGTYTINGVGSWDNGNSNDAAATIVVKTTNTAPVANNDTYATDEDTQLSVNAPGVLGNDTDADGNPLTASLVGGPSHGTLTLNANGSFTYTPAANYNGGDAFTYRANDGTTTSGTATATITVNPVADPLAVTAPADATVRWGQTATGTASATDPDGGTITWSLGGTPPTGATINSATGAFSWPTTEGQASATPYVIAVVATSGTRSAQATFKVTVGAHATALALGALPTVTYGQAATFTAQLVDADAGNAPVAGRPIVFALGTLTASGTTQSGGAAGTATGVFAANGLDAGTYDLAASFAGEAAYKASATSPVVKFTVAKAQATVALADATVEYDGTAKTLTPTVTPTGVGVSLTYGGSATAPKDAGTYAVVATVTDPNYTATPAQATLTIAKRQLAVSAAGVSREYDGTTNAAVTLSDDRVAGDALTLAYAGAAFADKNVGQNKTVTVSGISVTGAAAANYTFNTTATATASITPKALAAQVTVADKPYDGTTAATITDRALTGIIGPDQVALTGGTAVFSDKNVGTQKTVTITALTLGGDDAGNYTLDASVTAKADITARSLVVTATGVNRVYDGTSAATVTFADDRVSGDQLAYTYTASFADKNAGHDKPITITAFQVGGGDAGNYTAATPAPTKADITPAPLTGSVAVQNKLYDGTTAATITDRVLTGIIGPDKVALTGGTATFADKHVGTDKVVTLANGTLAGDDAGNYTLGGAVTGTADITPRALAVTAHGVNRVYDGTTAATATFTDDRLAGDAFTIDYSASFADKNVGTAKPVSVSGIALTNGAEAGDYTPNTTAAATADITPATLTPSIKAADKQYDGTTAATITDRSLAGIIGPDKVELTGGTATFADKHAGTGKTVTATGLSLTGDDAGNYTASATAAATADITPRPLAATAHGVNKIYDGTTAAQVTFTDDRLTGDAFDYGYSAAFDTKDVGTGKAVSVGGITLTGGAEAGDYTPNTTAAATADITPRPITVTADALTKVYGAADPALTYKLTAGTLVQGESISGALTRAAGEAVTAGGYQIQQGTLTAGSNYALTYVPASLAITKATPAFGTLTGTPTAVTLTYGATSTAVSGTIPFTPAVGVPGPSGSVAITLNGVTQQATIGANGAFATTFNFATPIPASPGLAIVYKYAGDGNFVAAQDGQGTVRVLYFVPAGGNQFLQPINPNLTTGNRSTFRINSTIPAKFQLFLADGVTPAGGQIANISVRKTANGVQGPVDEDVYSTVPDQGTTFRYDASGRQYIFNLGTKGWTEGTYRIIATLADGSTITADVEARTK